MLLAQIIHIVIGIYVFLLVLRMFVTGRDAYFNLLFNAVFRATEPVMAPVRRTFRRGPQSLDKADFTPLIPILALVALDGILTATLIPKVGFARGLSVRLLDFQDYAFLTFVVLILIFSVFYKYSRFPSNPFLRGAFKIMEPLYVTVGKIGAFFREHSGVTLFIAGFLLHLLVTSFILPFSLKGMTGLIAERPEVLAALVAGHSLLTLLALTTFFTYVIIVSALMSWISPDPMNPVVQIMHLLSEPINRPFRRIVPLIGGIDISPIFSIIALQLVARYGAQLINILFFETNVVKPV